MHRRLFWFCPGVGFARSSASRRQAAQIIGRTSSPVMMSGDGEFISGQFAFEGGTNESPSDFSLSVLRHLLASRKSRSPAVRGAQVFSEADDSNPAWSPR